MDGHPRSTRPIARLTTGTDLVGGNAEPFVNLTEDPTCVVGIGIQAAAQLMASVYAMNAVRFIAQAVPAGTGDT